MHRRHLLSTCASLSLAAYARRAGAADYPDRAIAMIVAYPPGGGTDVVARMLARYMAASLGQPVVVNNRAGAGGEIGFTELARARPDGYTIGFINTPNLVTIPIERRARYRLEDFSLIANVIDDPGGFFVLANSPFRSLADLVAHARANPEAVTYGTSGIGSDDHLAALAFERQAGVKLTHVPFSGAATVRNALLGGQITVASLNVSEGFADLQSGAARALGQMSERRWEQAPDVPTFREQGFDILEGSMRGVGAPAGLPGPVLDRLSNAVRDAVANPEFRQLAAQQALPLRFLAPDAFKAELVALREQYQKLWAEHPWRE
ncbi:tripartite tricarboxylate transporter substrate binding protein [Roseomonas sp. NAR14]|uniref:Tripartite tricarboxylate transporter substrate binding protein n=1 Tax=Roseomonas acroporae TaxID=2937791 RepID=A0A9X1YDB4_9PROT|nr:tripartite tricarboxylate transporter substrate binding protein [Roseomonas acroporae]MCK8786617.1 tripartite tricarboxylate transporter substrate binding protein [Roseomonas acroporae]